MGGAGGMRVDGGWDPLNCFRSFFLYHPKNRPSLSEPSDSLR